MVEMIGLGTMVALVWLIGWSMAGESESEKKRSALLREGDRTARTMVSEPQNRHAA
jgi:hypothetical protein